MNTGSRLKEHAFFDSEEPVDVLQALRDVRSRLESSRRTLVVNPRSGESLQVDWDEADELPRLPEYGIKRAVSLMKRYSDDAEVIDDCSVVLGFLCGECTRPDICIRVRILTNDIGGEATQDEVFDVALPNFVEGDVGFRIWGASVVLCRLLMDGMIRVKDETIVELGAASGLCGLVAHRLGAKRIYLTDFNEACIKASSHNASIEAAKKRGTSTFSPQFLDWSLPLTKDIPWENSLLLGAAVVYEKTHGQLMTHFLTNAFRKGAGRAIIAIHREHSGFEEFQRLLEQFGFDYNVLDVCEVYEDIGTTQVYVFDIARAPVDVINS